MELKGESKLTWSDYSKWSHLLVLVLESYTELKQKKKKSFQNIKQLDRINTNNNNNNNNNNNKL